jgi:MFS transporter, DHA1 family, multidrug resistance protein
MGVFALLLLLSVSTTLKQYMPTTSENVFSDTLALIKSTMVKIVSVGMASGLLYGIVFSFITISPSMIMQQFGLTKTVFSIYSLLATLSFVVGSIINIRLASVSPLFKFKYSSLFIAVLSVLFWLLISPFAIKGLIGILTYCYITFFFIGIAMPCSVTIMLGYSDKSAGFLAALTGFFHLTGSAIGAYAVTLISLEPIISFCLSSCGLSVASILICTMLKRN